MSGENPKQAFGVAKPSFVYIPPAGLLYVGQVMETGAAKYGPMNWRDTSVVNDTYVNATLRHLLAYWDGQDLDEESHLPHLAHVAANALIMLDAQTCGKLVDKRPTAGEIATLIRRYTKGTSNV